MQSDNTKTITATGQDFELLKQPLRIKNLDIHNRLVMAPMECRKTDELGDVSHGMLDYYDQRSRGGDFGLIITEHHFVSPEGRASLQQLSIVDDSKIESNRRLAELVHKNGSAIFMQLGHAGMMAKPLSGEGKALGASGGSVPSPMGGQISVTEMKQEDIDRVTECFAKAAVRAKDAGFDGVEIHAAHGYLLSQFYSPITNHRTDAYTGATLEGRIRFHQEVLQAVRKAVGAEFPISFRFGAYDYREDGSSMDEIDTASKNFVEAGADILSISCGMGGADRMTQPREGAFSDLAEIARKATGVPVITVGNIHTRSGAESLLQTGKADMVAIGRPIFRDADFARKMMND